jgi:hypothetical protein
MKAVGGCPVAYLERHAATFEPYFAGDFYSSINSIATGSRCKNGLNYALRKREETRYLNAVWVDIDCYNAAISPDEAAQTIADQIYEGTLPPPSATARSGRGLYALWFLHDANAPETSPAATPKGIDTQISVNCALVERFASIGADAAATDAARILRVHDSINSKNGQRVEWHLRQDEDGKPFTYALEYLAEFFGVKAPKKRGSFGRVAQRPGTAPKRAAGPIEKHKRCARDIEKIEAERGGWKKGSRWRCLTRYAQILRGAGLNRNEVTKRAEAMAQRCQPAFPSEAQDGTIAQIVNATFEGKIVNAEVAKLVTLFRVADEEARRLKLETILPDAVKAERDAEKKARSHTARKETRQDAIAAHVQAHPHDSASEVLNALQSQGFESSKRTVERELRELLPNRAKAKAGRKSTDSQQEPEKKIVPVTYSLSINKHFVAIKSQPCQLSFPSPTLPTHSAPISSPTLPTIAEMMAPSTSPPNW